jgi:hypothetical protein
MNRRATGGQFRLHTFDRFFYGVQIELAFLFAFVVAHELNPFSSGKRANWQRSL